MLARVGCLRGYRAGVALLVPSGRVMGGNVNVRSFCRLEESPGGLPEELTAIPRNYSQLRYNPAPDQKLWEILNSEGITTQELTR
jgi:hypothetical protein